MKVYQISETSVTFSGLLVLWTTAKPVRLLAFKCEKYLIIILSWISGVIVFFCYL